MQIAAVEITIDRLFDNPYQFSVITTMQEVGDNRTRAAEVLGINRGTLQNKLKEYGIQ